METIRRWAISWLNITPGQIAASAETARIDSLERKIASQDRRIATLIGRQEILLLATPPKAAMNDAYNAVQQVTDLHARFDALEDMLGVAIIVGPEGAVVSSTKDFGLLDAGAEYVKAVRAADQLLYADTQAMKGRTELLARFLARRQLNAKS